MASYWNGSNSGSIFFQMRPAPCPLCSDPANITMQVEKLIKLLEDTRKITHPDRCDHPEATDVTARINSCITEIRLRKRGG